MRYKSSKLAQTIFSKLRPHFDFTDTCIENYALRRNTGGCEGYRWELITIDIYGQDYPPEIMFEDISIPVTIYGYDKAQDVAKQAEIKVIKEEHGGYLIG